MPIFDNECQQCKTVFESIAKVSEEILPCPKCGADSKRIISGSYRQQDDSVWIRSVLDVVDRESKEPHTREFLKRPTRENYKNWMKATGLRHFEPGEERQRPQAPDLSKVKKETWENLQKRRRFSVG